jgi:hypothetical protein
MRKLATKLSLCMHSGRYRQPNLYSTKRAKELLAHKAEALLRQAASSIVMLGLAGHVMSSVVQRTDSLRPSKIPLQRCSFDNITVFR